MTNRRYPRYRLDRPVNVVLYWEDIPIRTLHGRCFVLGEGGMAATIADQLYLGDVVRLELPPLVTAYGSVRSVRGSEHGFEFLYTSDGQRKAVRRLCDACATDPAT